MHDWRRERESEDYRTGAIFQINNINISIYVNCKHAFINRNGEID